MTTEKDDDRWPGQPPANSFYDQTWLELQRRSPLAARKIEELRCETVTAEEFNELQTQVNKLHSLIKQVAIQVQALCQSLQQKLENNEEEP